LSVGGLQPGIDPARLKLLADELEVEEYLRIAREQSANDADFARFAGLRWTNPLS
jgi:hypothetical protein